MKLNRDVYHSLEADREWMSFHQYLNWTECAAKEQARQAGKYTQPSMEALLVGQYTHMELLTPEGTKAWIEKNKAEVLNAKGNKFAPYLVADRMIERVRKSQSAMALLDGEKERVIEFELGGVKWKAALDVADFRKDTASFTDLKSARDFEPYYDAANKTRVPWYEDYWAQFATYRVAYRSVLDVDPTIFVVGVTKQDPSDLALISFDNPSRMDAEVAVILAKLPHVLEMKAGTKPASPCRKNSCDFCRANFEPVLTVAESTIWPKLEG